VLDYAWSVATAWSLTTNIGSRTGMTGQAIAFRTD